MSNREYHLNRTKNRIASIKASIKSGRRIDPSDYKWLHYLKRQYQKNPKNISQEKIILIDTLIPLLGFDWREGENLIESYREKRKEELRALLAQKKPLTEPLKKWLYNQKSRYKNKPDVISSEEIALFDSLVSLGFNWRIPNVIIVRERNVKEIKELLTQGKPLPNKLENWLQQQQIQYAEKPEDFSSERIALLDSLSPLLGYSWKKRYRKREEKSEQMIKKISSALKSKRKLPIDAREWLRSQRQLYNAHPDTYSPRNKEKLDALNPLLGFDWKVFKRSRLFLPFEERVAHIKKELEAGNELQTGDKAWINVRRKIYRKEPWSITTEQLNLLNELNPLLEKPWNTPPKFAEKPKTFLEYVKEIKQNNTSYEALTARQKAWLQLQRKEYHLDKKGFSAEKVQILNALKPILGRDWKKYILKHKAPKRTSVQVADEIKRKLVSKTPLLIGEKAWLIAKRNAHKEQKLSEELIEKLDQLTPLLGYDWKVKQRYDAPRKTFEEYITDITEAFTTSGKISNKQKSFLRKQRTYYRRAPEEYPLYKIQKLDKLSVLLKKDWKKNLIEIPTFEEVLADIREQLTLKKRISSKQKSWLERYRHKYRKNPDSLRPDILVALDSLNVLLGYDWKSYEKEREHTS